MASGAPVASTSTAPQKQRPTWLMDFLLGLSNSSVIFLGSQTTPLFGVRSSAFRSRTILVPTCGGHAARGPAGAKDQENQRSPLRNPSIYGSGIRTVTPRQPSLYTIPHRGRQ